MKKINKVLAISLSLVLAGNLVGCNKKEEPKTPEVLTTTTAEKQVTSSTKTKESRIAEDTSKSTGTKKETKKTNKQNQSETKKTPAKPSKQKQVKSTTKTAARKTASTTTRKENIVVKPTTKATPAPTKPTTQKPTTTPTTKATQPPTTTTTTVAPAPAVDPWEVDWDSGSLSSDLNNMRYIPGDKIFYAKDFGFDPNKAGEAAVNYINEVNFDLDNPLSKNTGSSYYSLNGIDGNIVAWAVHFEFDNSSN